VPLTPVQRWFFEQETPDAHHYNQAMLLEVRERVDAEVARAAVGAVMAHHDALRLRFVHADAMWTQANTGPAASTPFETVDLADVAPEERAAEVERICGERQASLSLEHGPLLRAVLFETGDEQRFFIAIHHLAVDGVSWRVLLEDLETAVRQTARGEAVKLPPKTTSFREWSIKLAAHAASGALDGEMEYWTRPHDAPALPRDHAWGGNSIASAATVTVSLDAGETRALLTEVPPVYRTQANDVLLSALAAAFRGWTGSAALRVNLEGHGREELFDDADLTRTVGWFTSIYPVTLEPPEHGGPGEALKAVKEQLRAIPNKGVGFGVLRYLGSMEARGRLAALPEPEVSFNYLGQMDGGRAAEGLFATAAEGMGSVASARGRRAHLLDVNALVTGGTLRVSFTYSGEIHDRATIERLAAAYRAALLAAIAHCRTPGAGGFTPSDFPLARLDQSRLDRVLAGRGAVADVYPLSPLQQGMLFHSAMGHERQPYMVQLNYQLNGDVDVPALKKAWARVVDRHPVLRTGFAWEGLDVPLQVVAARVELPWHEEDWRGVDAAEREARLERYLDEERERGFDLTRPPLMRFGLFRTSDRSWEFVRTSHHLLSDGWSTPIVLREVIALHEGLSRGTEPSLPPARPFGDYVAWLDAQDMGAAEAFWRGALQGFTAPTPLGPAVEAVEGEAGHGDEHLRLDAETTRALRSLGRARQLTLNTLVQGAWALLLSRYSGEADVVFGATVSGRPAALEGVEQMVGMFINTLPVRARVRGEEPVSAWLRVLQEEQADARQYDFTPLLQAQAWSEVPRGRPLFESLVVFENYPIDAALQGKEGDTPVHDLRAARSLERTSFPLALLALPGGELHLQLGYDTGRFTPEAARRMLAHMGVLLAAIAADPDLPVSELPLLTAAERALILDEWNATRAEFPSGGLVHEAIAARAARAPDAPAISFEGRTLTYGELDRRTNQLARHLRAMGVGPETRVGLCMERSPEMVMAIVAVLKAGGAYVPLDPAYPAERIAFCLGDAAAPVVLTQSHLVDAIPPHAGETLFLDTLDLSHESAEPFDAGADADSLMYVIYTSGSTGKPKGVEVTHRNVARLFTATDAWFGFGEEDVWTLFHSYAFDFSVWEIWGALLYGGRLVVVPFGLSRDPAAFHTLCAREGVTVLNQTPSAFRQFMRVDEERGEALALRFVIFGGEALEPASLRGWVARHGDAMPELVNMYGITETTVHVTHRVIRREDVERGSGSPIGRPIPDLSIYVLDERREPVPIGVPGELYVGGAGVARGYLDRPELTAERFLESPFHAGERLYRTGDQARWMEDGTLEYLGRIDEQVKIRGFRIELGEIEAALLGHDAVREAVVVAREDRPGDRRLVAYVVAVEGRSVAPGELRSHLGETLPDYMVPAAFVPMEAIPLTGNGKVDRKALPVPGVEPRPEGAAYTAPASELEHTIAAVWAEVLDVERVGAHDNFFELGGNSLLLLQVSSRLQAELGGELRMVDLFRYPTVGALAASLASNSLDARAVHTTQERAAELDSGKNRMARLRRGGR
jgi:amino acid adenylation domain-containing protein/non-ribosomal peptide synthase protein (TIGR01720 family)